MDEVVQALSDIIKLNTVNGHEKLVADYLADLLKQHGIDSRTYAYEPDRVSLVAEIGDGNGPVVGFDGHEDIVALGDAAKWQVDALSATIKDYRNPVLGAITPVVTMVKGGEQINTVPATADLSVKIRTIPELPNADITVAIKAIIADLNAAGADLTLEIHSDLRPMHTMEDTPLVQAAKEIGSAELQQALPLIGVPGGTDASSFLAANPDIDVIVFGPGNITAHQVNEYVDLDMYHRFITIYEKLVTKLLK